MELQINKRNSINQVQTDHVSATVSRRRMLSLYVHFYLDYFFSVRLSVMKLGVNDVITKLQSGF